MAEINPASVNATTLKSPQSPAPSAAEPGGAENFWGEDGFSFGDILDLINPLQHLPIIGTLYRAATEDTMSTGSSILGGGLFGGIIGAGVAVVNAVIEEATGGEITDHVMALFGAGDSPPGDGDQAPVVLASSDDRGGFGAALGRRAQEATSSDLTPSDPTSRAPRPAGAERSYAFDPAFGRGAQEATMTSLASFSAKPAAPAETTLPVVASLPVVEPPIQAPATPPAWLAAAPRGEADFVDAALQGLTPQAELQLMQAIQNYSHQAAMAKSISTEPGIIDILY